MEKHYLKIDEKNEDIRLDVYVSEVLENISRSKIQDLIKNGDIKVNSKIQKPSYKLKCDDEVEIGLKEDEQILILPQDITLDIVYEDENMLVVNKPSGMLTHPTAIERQNTLVNALLYKYGENLSDINGEFRRGILHRLDRNTSGLLMVAKNNKAHEFLTNQIKEKTAVRKYLSVVKGKIEKDLEINMPIGRHKKEPKMAIDVLGKKALTKIKVLENFRNFTYIECTLSTGR